MLLALHASLHARDRSRRRSLHIIMSNKGAVVVFVTVKIKEGSVDDFLKAMEIDVAGSRKEEGCLRFDLLEGDGERVYHFYESYKDADAAAFHKTTAHYKAWADFKAAGGVEDQVRRILTFACQRLFACVFLPPHPSLPPSPHYPCAAKDDLRGHIESHWARSSHPAAWAMPCAPRFSIKRYSTACRLLRVHTPRRKASPLKSPTPCVVFSCAHSKSPSAWGSISRTAPSEGGAAWLAQAQRKLMTTC